MTRPSESMTVHITEQHWEYRVERRTVVDDADLQDVLNAAAGEGWELTHWSTTYGTVLIFKRPRADQLGHVAAN